MIQDLLGFQLSGQVATATRSLRPSGGDDTAQLQAAVNAGGITCLAPGNYTQAGTLDLTGAQGGALIGLGGTSRWRPVNSAPVLINYTGSGTAVQVVVGNSVHFDNYTTRGIRWDGANAGASSVGLVLQTGTTGNTFVEGLLFEDAAFTNFGLNQIQLSGNVFDITFRRCTAHNMTAGTDNVIACSLQGSAAPLQNMFDDCWLVQSQNGKWAFFSDVSLAASVRFVGGTVVTGNAAGTPNTSANGIHCLGSLELFGTHIEGCNLAVEWAGTRGATIISNEIVSNTVGVSIGSSLNTAFAANNAYVAGPNNNTIDVLVLAGTGSKAGSVIGPLGLNAVVTDNRAGTNGVYEVSNLNANPPQLPALGSSLAGGGRLLNGSGAPSKPAGVNPVAGDYYLRTDTPGTASQRLYVCTTGGAAPVWAGIV